MGLCVCARFRSMLPRPVDTGSACIVSARSMSEIACAGGLPLSSASLLAPIALDMRSLSKQCASVSQRISFRWMVVLMSL